MDVEASSTAHPHATLVTLRTRFVSVTVDWAQKACLRLLHIQYTHVPGCLADSVLVFLLARAEHLWLTWLSCLVERPTEVDRVVLTIPTLVDLAFLVA